ncbi:MAG: hypothetical protein ACOC40_02160 [Thermoplasmatota archaeon]
MTLSPTTGGIEEINMVISLAAGAKTQDLNQTLIRVYSNDKDVSLKAGEIANEGNYSYFAQIKPDGGADSSYIESGDKYKLTINLTAKNDNGESIIGALEAQDELDINIVPKHGIATYENVVAPPTITEKMIML